MPRIKSAKKRVDVAERNRLRNAAAKSRFRNAIRKVLDGIGAKKVDTTTLEADRREACSLLDRAVLKGILKKNTAARYKSRLDKAVAGASA